LIADVQSNPCAGQARGLTAVIQARIEKGTMCGFPLNVSRETIGRAPQPHVPPGQIFDHAVQPARRFESEDVREDRETVSASRPRVLCPMRA